MTSVIENELPGHDELNKPASANMGVSHGKIRTDGIKNLHVILCNLCTIARANSD